MKAFIRFLKERKQHFKLAKENARLKMQRDDILKDMNKRIKNAETEAERQKVIEEKEEFINAGKRAMARAEAKLKNTRNNKRKIFVSYNPHIQFPK